MCVSWRAGPLPIDLDKLAPALGLQRSVVRRLLPTLALQFRSESQGYVCPALEAEFERVNREISGKRRGAALTNAKRWGTPSLATSEATSEATSLSVSPSYTSSSPYLKRPSALARPNARTEAENLRLATKAKAGGVADEVIRKSYGIDPLTLPPMEAPRQ
jgi:hypothetical protein